MQGLDIKLFGPPRAERAGVPLHVKRHKTLALLAYLAATGKPHGRDALIALLWPDLDEERGRAALRGALYDLGKTVGKEWLDLEGDQAALRAGPGLQVDVLSFRALLASLSGHGHPAETPCENCLTALVQAADLYRDDFLAGFTLKDSTEFDAWQTAQTESLRLELAAALEKLALGFAARRQYDLALAPARRSLALDPLNEHAHRLLMRLYAENGDRATAARQYQQCRHTLAVELGIEPAPETTDLYRRLLDLPAGASERGAAPSPAPFSPAQHNLPPDVTPFIGRAEQLATVAGQLADPACRLLTVLGPGGIGKTRLAVQAARDALAAFQHGVWFVDLAPVASAETLASAILATLHVPELTSRGTDQALLAFLQDRNLLLVLDNYEHLLTGPEPDRRDGYGLVMKLVSAAPQVKLLVTSRTRLNVGAEWLAPLEGMAVPPAPADASPRRQATAQPADVLENYCATALFVSCARRLRPRFRPGAVEAAFITQICRQLDGLPLAIELAAAWTRVLSLAEIAARLQRGPDLLTTRLRDLPARHRSITATFDHSWQLLTERERSVLRQLSVFRGGFTRGAAEAVAGARLVDLANLVDASWLRLAETGRYTLHELVRQYCAARLESEHEALAGETAGQVAGRHAAYFQSVMFPQFREYMLRKGAIAEAMLDWGNLVAAWSWTVAADDYAGLWPLRWGIGYLADRRGLYSEACRLVETGLEALTAAQTSDRDRPVASRKRAVMVATLLVFLSEGYERVGRLQEAGALLSEAREVLGEHDTGGAHWSETDFFRRRMLGWLDIDIGKFDEAGRLFAELFKEAESGGVNLLPYDSTGCNMWPIELLWALGYAALAVGDYREALRLAGEGIDRAERMGSLLLTAYSRRVRVLALFYLGEYDRADREARKVLSAVSADAFADTLLRGQALMLLGRTKLITGQHAQALSYFRQCLALARQTGMTDLCAAAIAQMGEAELAAGNLAAAEHLYDRAAAHSDSIPLYGRVWLAIEREDTALALRLSRQWLAVPSLQAPMQGMGLALLADSLAHCAEPERAAEICGFLLAWRGATYRSRQTAERVLADLTGRLPAVDLASALERGSVRTIGDF